MDIEEFRCMFTKAPEKFPSGLEARYPRLLQQILAKWGTPHEMEAYLKDLVVDLRGNRQGFPHDILKEILFISNLFEKWRSERKRKAPANVIALISPGFVEGLEKAQLTLNDELGSKLRAAQLKIQRDDVQGMGELGSLLNQRDKDGMTLLMHAACYGAEKCMIQLVKSGANPHMADTAGNTALHWAVTMTRLRVAEILMYFGSDPSRKNKAGVGPLALAAIKPDPILASRLVDYGADVNMPDGKGDFPIHKAASAGASETVKFLLVAGALKDMKNRAGQSPLDLNNSTHADEVLKAFNEHQAELLRSSMGGERRG